MRKTKGVQICLRTLRDLENIQVTERKQVRAWGNTMQIQYKYRKCLNSYTCQIRHNAYVRIILSDFGVYFYGFL